jgi:glycosyltransferase involved in cell wall biosynthesis
VPLISIITVNYNDALGLERTIKSVQEQTATDYEHIIIDGGSADGSKEVIERYKNSFSHWVSEPDNGIYSAMNKGIKASKGVYLLFLNSGDHFQNHLALEKAYSFLTGEAIVYFDLEVVDKEKTFIKSYPELLSFSYFVEDTLPHPASFIKKDAFATTGAYKEDFKVLSDWKFFIDAICKYGMSYKRVPHLLSTFYLGGISSDQKNRAVKYAERQEILQNDYKVYFKDIDDILFYKRIVKNFRDSRIIACLVHLGLLNKF